MGRVKDRAGVGDAYETTKSAAKPQIFALVFGKNKPRVAHGPPIPFTGPSERQESSAPYQTNLTNHKL
jgi:hypothetical protein